MMTILINIKVHILHKTKTYHILFHSFFPCHQHFSIFSNLCFIDVALFYWNIFHDNDDAIPCIFLRKIFQPDFKFYFSTCQKKAQNAFLQRFEWCNIETHNKYFRQIKHSCAALLEIAGIALQRTWLFKMFAMKCILGIT